MEPEARLAVDGQEVYLLGTVAGAVQDGARVEAAIQQWGPDRIALGIPPEDLDGLRALLKDPDLGDDLPDLDGPDAHFVELLARFGPVQVVPSPDLAAAAASGLPLDAVDLGDHEHTRLYTTLVGLRHLVQRRSAHKKLQAMEFDDASDRFQLALAWDAVMARVKPLAALEAAREAHMAKQIRAGGGRVLAVVPSTRLEGIRRSLQE